MNSQELLVRLQKQSPNKIVVIVVDGLGGLAHPDYDHKSELEYADLPNLDALVRMRGTVLGTHHPIARGFIPGSAAGHLALFGYDPLLPQHHLGRGIFEALELPLSPGGIVARLGFGAVRGGAAWRRGHRPAASNIGDFGRGR